MWQFHYIYPEKIKYLLLVNNLLRADIFLDLVEDSFFDII